jgi:hypothetical protein
MDKEYYMRFPSVLRKALENREISFDEETKFSYAPFVVFRGITRNKGDDLEIKRKDFLSYAELGKKPRGKKTADIGWYSCSCFLEKDELAEALKLPRYNKKIIKGTLEESYGPQKTNDETKHVDWWLYDKISFEKKFEVI